MVADKVCEVPKESTATTTAHVSEEAVSEDPRATTQDTSSGVIPSSDQFVLFDSAAEKSVVDENCNNVVTDQALTVKAEQLRDILNPNLGARFLAGITLSSPIDAQKVVDLIGGLSQGDLARFAPIYGSLDNTNDLMFDLQTLLPKDRFAELEMNFRETSEGTNLAGAVNLALVKASMGQVEDAGNLIRSAFATASDEDIARAQADWNQNFSQRYGNESLLAAVDSSQLSGLDKQLFDTFYSHGFESRDVAAAANLVATSTKNQEVSQNYGMNVFQFVAGSDTNKQVRADLMTDENFKTLYTEAFGEHAFAEAYLKDGKLTLRENLKAFQDGLLLFTNVDEAIGTSVSNVTPEDRQKYALGHDLATMPDQSTLTVEQKEAVDFYQDVHNSLVALGRDDRAARWSDMLLGGEIVSKLADQSIHSMLTDQSMKIALQQMSESDWNKLKTEDGSKSAYYADLQTFIKSHAMSDDAAASLTGMLDQIAAAPSFDKIQIAHEDFMTELQAGSLPNGDPFKLAEAIANMSPEMAQKYVSDPSFKQLVDNAVFGKPEDGNQYFDGPGRAASLYAQMMLKTIGPDGAPPVEGENEALVRQFMNSELTDPDKQQMAMLTLFRNPEIAAICKDMYSNSGNIDTQFENNVYFFMESLGKFSLDNLVQGKGLSLATGPLNHDGPAEGYTNFSQNYELSLNDPQAYQAEYADLAPGQKVQDAINAQKGVTEPVDYARIYDINQQSMRHGIMEQDTFRDTFYYLAGLDEAGRQAFMQEYQDKYQVPFGSEFIARAKAENSDPRYQQLFDKIAENGYSVNLEDAIRLAVLDKTHDVQGFEQELATMSPEQIGKLITDYAGKYQSDLEGDLLGLTGANYADSITISSLLSTQDSPLDTFIERTLHFSSNGLEVDGTHAQVLSALQRNRELLEQFALVKQDLPPEALKAVDDYFRAALVNNLNTKDNMAAVAQAAIDSVVMGLTIASCFSGPIGVAALAGVVTTATQRVNMMRYIKGESLTHDEEVELGIHTAWDLAGSVGVNVLLNSARTAYVAYKTGMPLSEALKASSEEIAIAIAARKAAPATTVKSTAQTLDSAAPTIVANNVDSGANLAKEVPVNSSIAPEANITSKATEVKTTGVAEEVNTTGAVTDVTTTGTATKVNTTGTAADANITGNAVDVNSTGVATEQLQTETIVAQDVPEQLSLDFGPEVNQVATSPKVNTAVAPEQLSFDFVPSRPAALTEDVAKSTADGAALPQGVQRTVTVNGKSYYVMADGKTIPVVKEEPIFNSPSEWGLGKGLDKEPVLQSPSEPIFNKPSDWTLPEGLGTEPIFNKPSDWKLPEGLGTEPIFNKPSTWKLPKGADAEPIFNSPSAWKLPDAFANAKLAVPKLVTAPLVVANNVADIADVLDFEPTAEVPEAPAAPMPTAALIEMATVRRGEGPWQTAERILAASGGKFDVLEVRALSNAIKAVYAADTGNPDIGGLKVKHNFITNDNFDDLLAAVNDDAVKAALMGFSASPVS